MDQAIAIRTLIFRGDTYSYQAGAGIVADSVPENRVQRGAGQERDPALSPGHGGGRIVSALAANQQPKLLLIDNYDSFTYNLVQAFMVLGADVQVYRNDEISVEQALAFLPSHLCISPGPGRPDDAGLSLAMLAAFERRVPILGVCLGHQSLVQHFGGRIVSAERLMHGKTSMIGHDGRTIFEGLSKPFQAGRYHSLAAEACQPARPSSK